MKNKILVAGGSGFLGSNLIKALNLKQYDITVLLKTRRTKFIKKEKIKYFVCNIKRKNNFKLIDKKFDYIINFSGNIDHKNKSETMNVHYFGLKNLLNHIDKRYLKLFIQIGSSLEYGRKNSPQKENRKCKPISNYGKAKYLATNYVLKNIKKSIVLRLYQVYGPGQKKDRLIPYVIENCLKNKTFNSSEGLQMRDFLYIKDAVCMTLWLTENDDANGLFNLGNGKARTWLDLANAIFAALNLSPNIRYIEMPEILREKYQYFTEAVVTKLESTGFPTTFFNLEDAVQDYVTNYLAPKRKLGEFLPST